VKKVGLCPIAVYKSSTDGVLFYFSHSDLLFTDNSFISGTCGSNSTISFYFYYGWTSEVVCREIKAV
jgi:hypothetical protein